MTQPRRWFAQPAMMPRSGALQGQPAFEWKALGSLEEYNRFVANMAPDERKLEAVLAEAHPQEAFTVPGHCWIDATAVSFEMDAAPAGSATPREPNWREQMACPICRMNGRQRSALHIATEMLGLDPHSRVYMTEQVTPLFRLMRTRVPDVIGSEFLGPDVAPGSVNDCGIRHEDLTRLSLRDASVDAILSFDVLEHIPHFEKALAECLRILAPGGAVLFSVPFLQDRDSTRIRAHHEADGTLVHDQPPQYHGDPVQPEHGLLCYQEFGWDLLDHLRKAGFERAHAIDYHDNRFGYLGTQTLLFVARKRKGLADSAAEITATAKETVKAVLRTVMPLPARRAIRGLMKGKVRPATYDDQLAQEIARFESTVTVHDLPNMFHYWAHRWIRPKMQSVGFSHPEEFFVNYLERAYHRSTGGTRRFVSLGAGNCDAEVRVAATLRSRGLEDFVIECVEINPAMLKRGASEAARQGVQAHVHPVSGDFNRWVPDGRYDAVMANQSLHHVTNLEGLFESVGKAIDGHGLFAISDMIGRNGHLRWPEALAIVQEFWAELPQRYRFNLLLRRHEETFLDWDCSGEGFEGIRAQDILPLALQRFSFDLFAPYGNVIDPFVDRSFGHHYNPDSDWDRTFIERVHERDELEIKRGSIKPTHVIAVMGAGRKGEGLYLDGLSPEFCVR